jgi:Skp family chaperone for outer membrane proteins
MGTHFDWVAMLASAQRCTSRLLKSQPAIPADNLESIYESAEFEKMQAAEFERILKQQEEQKQALKDKVAEVTTELLTSKQVLDMCSQFLPYIQKLVTSQSFWQRVKQGLWLLVKAIRFK